MSGSETGNVLIQDKREDDPFVWKYKKADRNGRIRYPEEVGNLMKETTEQVVTAVANPLTSAQFMTGRVLFAAGSTGASTLPTALTILTLLNNYYNFTKRSATYTNSNSVANRISSEISVEFSNQSGGTVTLARGTGNTFVGFTSPVTIPDDATLRLKFVVVTSSPVAAFEVYIDGGNIAQYANTLVTPPVLTLPLQAPDQLVVYDPATLALGYVDNTVLAPAALGDVFLGWNAGTNTISRRGITGTTAAQLVTRNAGTGELIFSTFANIPNGVATDYSPIAVNSSGNIVKSPNTGHTWRNKNGEAGPGQSVPNLNNDVVTYTFNSSPSGLFTYAAGVFTALEDGIFQFNVTCSTDVVAPNSYFQIQVDGVAFGSTGYMTSQTTATIAACRDIVAGQQIQVLFNNASGGPVVLISGLPTSNDFKAVRVGP